MSERTQVDRHRVDHLLVALWRNWAISVGALILPLILALFLPKIWIPFICLAEGYALISMMRADITSGVSSCSLIVRLTSRVLLITSIVMFGVVILCTDWLVPTVIYLDLYNSEIPFITCLIVFPVALAFCLMYRFLGIGERHSREIQRINGFYAGDSVLATLYYRESKYQLVVLMLLSIILGVVEYWYFFTRYINSDMNVPDRFFFNYLPAAMYLMTLFVFVGRYTSMRAMYKTFSDESHISNNNTLVRFLVVVGDELLLQNIKEERWDTPVESLIGRCRSISEPQARDIFTDKTGVKDFAIRYCFANDSFAEGSNIIHYAVFISDTDVNAFDSGNCVLFNASMLDAAMSANALAPLLANELYRIHTMTMAWKTYDRKGCRIYPVKNYRPSFRLRDLVTWDIDYDDYTWFDIAHNNEDRKFFKLRRFWHRITGVLRTTGKRG
ncbi:MAG: hypothetical protein J1F05_00585 [Muribaculaceae bacterium]|nr:hypothetical protein [Muribaculaceae bacterium]